MNLATVLSSKVDAARVLLAFPFIFVAAFLAAFVYALFLFAELIRGGPSAVANALSEMAEDFRP